MKVKIKDRAVELLRKNNLSFTPEDVLWVIETYDLGVEDKKAFAQEVVAEGLQRTVNIVQTFFETVSDARLPKEAQKIEERLQKRDIVRAWCFPDWVRSSSGGTRTSVEVGSGKGVLRFSLYSSRVFENLQLKAVTGVVGLDATDFPVRSKVLNFGSWGWDGQAFFVGNEEEALEKALKIAISLRPVLSVMGLSDLEEKFTLLGNMEGGERRVEGGYTLIREERIWFLKRGSFMGDPDLDRALLRGEPITLTFPGDVEISFKAEFSFKALYLHHKVSLVQGYFRFGEEVVPFGPEDGFSSGLAGVGTIESALRWGLLRKFDRWEQNGGGSFFEGLSPKTIAALRAFTKLKDPFWFLAEGKFHAQATAQLFLDF